MRYLKWVIPAVVLLTTLVVLVFPAHHKALTTGDMAPDFRLRDLKGNDFFSNRYQGKVLLINFWATWCAYCCEELPLIESFNQKYAAMGLQSVSILKDVNNIDLALEITTKNSITYPVLLDKDEELFRTFGAYALPHTVLVDRSGKIRFIHLGFNPKDEPQLEKEILQLLEEK